MARAGAPPPGGSPAQGARVLGRRVSTTCAPISGPAPELRRSELDQVRCGRPDSRAQPGSALSTRLSPSRLLRPQSLHTPAAGSKPTAHPGAGYARGLETRHPEDGPEVSGGSPQQHPGEASQRPGSAARRPLPAPAATRRLRRTGTSLQNLLPTSTHTHTQTKHGEAGSMPGHRPDPTPASPNGESHQRSLVTQHTPGVTSPRTPTPISRKACPPTLPESGPTATPQGLLTTQAGHPCV